MRLYQTTATFTRPANTTAYLAGQLVANNTVAASVVPMTFVIPVEGFLITSVKIFDQNGGITPTQFLLNLYQFPPTPVNGDGGTYSTSESDWLGQIFVDCSLYSSINNSTSIISNGWEGFSLINPYSVPVIPDTNPANIYSQFYGLLQTYAAYTPSSGEIFTITLTGSD